MWTIFVASLYGDLICDSLSFSMQPTCELQDIKGAREWMIDGLLLHWEFSTFSV